jgi:hypothetical protein
LTAPLAGSSSPRHAPEPVQKAVHANVVKVGPLIDRVTGRVAPLVRQGTEIAKPNRRWSETAPVALDIDQLGRQASHYNPGNAGADVRTRTANRPYNAGDSHQLSCQSLYLLTCLLSSPHTSQRTPGVSWTNSWPDRPQWTVIGLLSCRADRRICAMRFNVRTQTSGRYAGCTKTSSRATRSLKCASTMRELGNAPDRALPGVCLRSRDGFLSARLALIAFRPDSPRRGVGIAPLPAVLVDPAWSQQRKPDSGDD